MPTVVIDSREKKPYEFPGVRDTRTERLNVGDYTIEGYEDVFAVERKTLDDLAQSLGVERERFEAEVQRAQSLAEFVVMIEAPKSHVYEYAGTKRSPHYYSNIYPNSIIGTVEGWAQKYDTLTFRWAQNRERALQETLQQLDEWLLEYSEI